MTTAANDRTTRRLCYIRHVQRVACTLARVHTYFDADLLAKHIMKPPLGVDPRVVGNALHGLRADGLIERIEYKRLDVKRCHGRPQSLWRAKDPAGIDEWLRQNPPGEDEQPVTIQLTLSF